MFLPIVKFLVLTLCFQNVFHTIDAEVKVSVLYETLCPDSKQFITNQLYDTYLQFGSDYINLEMFPYGHVKDVEINGTMVKSCQHGPDECYGNKVHGCVLKHYSVSDSLGFIYCSESSISPAQNSTIQKCALSNNISWTKIEDCLKTGEADDIFEKNGEFTNMINPVFIPYIIFNGVANETLQNLAVIDLNGVICGLLDGKTKPSYC